MNANYQLIPLSPADRESVVDIFNYYVENSFAAFPESRVSDEFFNQLFKICEGFPAVTVKENDNRTIGFGMLRAHNPLPAFSRVAAITYFLMPGYTRQGIGTYLLSYLIDSARLQGITSLLASISSLNAESIAFHSKHGFEECGRLREIGMKNGKIFDVVWMQRML
jgi:L-amino acid N-acyltransferase YncA